MKRSSVARAAIRFRMPSRSGSSACALGILPSRRSASSLQRRADVADHLGLREIDLLDIGRLIADMDHLRPFVAHDEGRLLDRVVADGDDEVGALDRLVHVVALGERRGAHVELGAAGHGALAHLRREVGNAGAQHELGEVRGRARPRGRGPEHHQRTLRLHDHLGRAIERVGARQRAARPDAAEPARPRRTPRPRCLRAAPDAPGPDVPPRATRNASRTSVGIIAGETIWRDSFVSGFIAATMSTIWKRAWRDDRMPFCPVIMIIGIAPSSA